MAIALFAHHLTSYETVSVFVQQIKDSKSMKMGNVYVQLLYSKSLEMFAKEVSQIKFTIDF